MTNKTPMLSRLDDIERLVKLSCTQYDDAAEAYKEAERMARKKAEISVYTPNYACFSMMCDKARKKAEDLYKEARETTSRIEWARKRFKADYPDQYTGWL